MRTPLQGGRANIIEAMLPDDPEPGQKFKLEKGQTVGGATVINIRRSGELLGSIQTLNPIPNLSGRYAAVRVTSTRELKPGELLRVQGLQYTFISLQFVEGYGWMGDKTLKDPTVLLDKYMRVLHVLPVGDTTENFYLYEQVAFSAIKGASDEPHTPWTTSRNTTTTQRGTPDAQGSDRTPSWKQRSPRRRTNNGGTPRSRYVRTAAASNDGEEST